MQKFASSSKKNKYSSLVMQETMKGYNESSKLNSTAGVFDPLGLGSKNMGKNFGTMPAVLDQD